MLISGYYIEFCLETRMRDGALLRPSPGVLKAWNVLARRQISIQLIEIESRPHLSLFVSPLSRNFASKEEPLYLSSSVGTFSNPNNVLFLSQTHLRLFFNFVPSYVMP